MPTDPRDLYICQTSLGWEVWVHDGRGYCRTEPVWQTEAAARADVERRTGGSPTGGYREPRIVRRAGFR